MSDNIVVPQSPTSPGVIVTDDKGYRGHGLEGKDATFLQSTQFALANQFLNRDIVENRAVFERGLGANHTALAIMAKDGVIEMLKTDARRGEQLVAIQAQVKDGYSAVMARLDAMDAKTNATALQDAKDEITLLKTKFGVIP